MAVIITLVLSTLGARLVGRLGPESWDYVDSWPEAVAVGLAAMFLVTGVGVLELLGAAGLLYPPTRVAAAVCLFLLMVVMFPANVYASRIPTPPKSMTTRLDVRTAEQALYLAAAAVVVGLGGIQ